MSDETRRYYLRIALIVVGLLAIFGFYPLSIVWPSGWAWGHGHSHYLMMIVGIYATLGVFLLIASRNPDAHRASSGLPCGRAWCTERSWQSSRSAMRPSAVICWQMYLRCSSLRSYWEY